MADKATLAEKTAPGAAPSFAERILAHANSREGRQRDPEKVVSIGARIGDGATAATPAREEPGRAELRNPAGTQDFSAAIDLIHEASEAVRISEQRAEDLEREINGLLQGAADEVERLRAELAAKDALIARGVEQVRAAEARAHEAEAWLARLHEAVMSSLSPLQKSRAS